MNKKGWNNISVQQFYKITDLLKEPDDYTVLNLIDVIYDIDSANLPLTEFSKYNEALDFLNTDIPVVNLQETYKLGDTEYKTGYNLTTVTAAQFIDYQNYTKNKSDKWEDYLSVMFIPVGHNYNDGYDMTKTKNDILEMPITVVRSLVFFYTLQFEVFLHHFLLSLKQSVKKMKLTKEQKKIIYKKIEEADLASLESFQLF